MSLQFKRVWTSVGTMRTLVRSLSTVTSHVSLQFAQLHRHVVTIRTLVRFLMSVSVSHVSHQLSTRGEGCFTVFTSVRLGSSVSVDVVVETGQGLESSLTHVTLVRSVLRVGLHVSAQQVSLGCGVVTIVAGEF